MSDGSATNHYALTKKYNLALPGGRSQISNEDYTGGQVDGDMDCYYLLAYSRYIEKHCQCQIVG